MDIVNSVVVLEISAMTAGLQKYKSIIKKKRKKNEKTVMLAKTKLNSLEILISRDFFDLFISPD